MTDFTSLRQFLAKLLLQHGDTQPLGEDDRLFTSGRLDSMDLMELSFFLEERYGLDFSHRGATIEELDSLAIIGAALPPMIGGNG